MSLALNEEALTLLFVGRLLVAVDVVVVCCVCCCVLFGFIDGKGFIALDFLAFFLLAFLFAVFVSAVKLFRTRISTLSLKSFTALVIVLAPPFQGDYVSASNNPLYASFIALACYTGAYVLLKEEGVDEGLENFKLGIGLKNEAKYAIGASVTIGTLYTLNHLFFADGYAGAGGTTFIPGFEDGSYWPDSESFNPASTTPLSFRVLAAFFVVLVSMGLVLLTQGAKGNWAVAHISLFSVTFFTLAVIVGAAVNNDQVIPAGPYEGTYTPDDSTNASNMAVSALVLFLNVYGYYKMREEGVEDGMTFGGKDFGNKDDFFFKMYPAVTAVYVVLLLIANYVTQPL